MARDKLPILYLYIYRSLLKRQKEKVLTNKEALKALGTVIRRAPMLVYDEVLDEMAGMGFSIRVNRQRYLLLSNSFLKKQLKRLKEYAFPFIS